jgi:hypothetical protein
VQRAAHATEEVSLISPYLKRPIRTLEQALADIAEAKRKAERWRSGKPAAESDEPAENKQDKKVDTY